MNGADPEPFQQLEPVRQRMALKAQFEEPAFLFNYAMDLAHLALGGTDYRIIRPTVETRNDPDQPTYRFYGNEQGSCQGRNYLITNFNMGGNLNNEQSTRVGNVMRAFVQPFEDFDNFRVKNMLQEILHILAKSSVRYTLTNCNRNAVAGGTLCSYHKQSLRIITNAYNVELKPDQQSFEDWLRALIRGADDEDERQKLRGLAVVLGRRFRPVDQALRAPERLDDRSVVASVRNTAIVSKAVEYKVKMVLRRAQRRAKEVLENRIQVLERRIYDLQRGAGANEGEIQELRRQRDELRSFLDETTSDWHASLMGVGMELIANNDRGLDNNNNNRISVNMDPILMNPAYVKVANDKAYFKEWQRDACAAYYSQLSSFEPELRFMVDHRVGAGKTRTAAALVAMTIDHLYPRVRAYPEGMRVLFISPSADNDAFERFSRVLTSYFGINEAYIEEVKLGERLQVRDMGEGTILVLDEIHKMYLAKENERGNIFTRDAQRTFGADVGNRLQSARAIIGLSATYRVNKSQSEQVLRKFYKDIGFGNRSFTHWEERDGSDEDFQKQQTADYIKELRYKYRWHTAQSLEGKYALSFRNFLRSVTLVDYDPSDNEDTADTAAKLIVELYLRVYVNDGENEDPKNITFLIFIDRANSPSRTTVVGEITQKLEANRVLNDVHELVYQDVETTAAERKVVDETIQNLINSDYREYDLRQRRVMEAGKPKLRIIFAYNMPEGSTVYDVDGLLFLNDNARDVLYNTPEKREQIYGRFIRKPYQNLRQQSLNVFFAQRADADELKEEDEEKSDSE